MIMNGQRFGIYIKGNNKDSAERTSAKNEKIAENAMKNAKGNVEAIDKIVKEYKSKLEEKIRVSESAKCGVISKKEFLGYMGKVKEINDGFHRICNTFCKEGVEMFHLLDKMDSTDALLEVLSKAMGLGDDDILSWWIYEEGWGEEFEIGDIVEEREDDDSEWREPDLSDIDKLWKYCVWLSEKKKE